VRKPWLYLAYAVFAIAFTWIYTKGYEATKPASGQGLRYGFWMGLLLAVYPNMQGYYAMSMSWKLSGAWAVTAMAEYILAAMAVALIYRPAPHPGS